MKIPSCHEYAVLSQVKLPVSSQSTGRRRRYGWILWRTSVLTIHLHSKYTGVHLNEDDVYQVKSPEYDQPDDVIAPIEYTTLQPHHLQQVHDLLERVFWSGING
jgi:hypothetical protein